MRECKECRMYPPSQNCGECPRYLADEELYPETLIKFDNVVKTMIKKYGLSEDRAACYLCNFEDQYICKEYNGGCKLFEKCKEIKCKETIC